MTTQTRKGKGQRAEWPKHVTAGSVVVKVYRCKHATNASGFSYEVVWVTPDGRKKQRFADVAVALEEARMKADQLAHGRVEGAEMTRTDRDELQMARKLVEGKGTLLTALGEWAKAWDVTNGHVLDAAEAWAQKHVTTRFKRTLAGEAVEQFIRYKESRGKKAERTYGSKLRPIKDHFTDRYLDEITSLEWSRYLGNWKDGVTQNDFRKRAVELCRWGRDIAGFLPRGVPTEVELTERAHEEPSEIGILSPDAWRRILNWTWANHPEHLAALVIAGFCGVRSDEVHGKRDDRLELGHECKRQTWEDIDLAQKHLNVTNAKRNTPAWRLVPVCETALSWLTLCPGNHKGAVCEPGAMEKLRLLLRGEGKFDLPENCFRHSYITYQIAVIGDKAKVANWAGNSVKEIDRRYRRPALPEAGAAWFAAAPQGAKESARNSGAAGDSKVK